MGAKVKTLTPELAVQLAVLRESTEAKGEGRFSTVLRFGLSSGLQRARRVKLAEPTEPEPVPDAAREVQEPGQEATDGEAGPEVEQAPATSPEPAPEPAALAAKPEAVAGEMVEADFRFLSAVFIEDRYIDFSEAGVLEAAVDLWGPQADLWGNEHLLTCYKNHDIDVDEWCGQVVKAWFAKAEGSVPGGVEGTIRFDAVSEPKLCRGLLLGTVRATSAGLRFTWRPSHDMEIDEFFWRMGEVVDGEVVRMIVTEITEVMEQSVVWEGADAWAKRRLAATRPDLAGDIPGLIAAAKRTGGVNKALLPLDGGPGAANLGAVKVHDCAAAEEGLAWSAKAAIAELKKWASSDGSGDKGKIERDRFQTGFAWFDSAAAEVFGSHKLPHHTAEGTTLQTVWKGVSAAMNALSGGRGGVDVPEEDREAVYNHLAAHYKLWEKEPPAVADVLAAAKVTDLVLSLVQKAIGSDPRQSEQFAALDDDASPEAVRACLEALLLDHEQASGQLSAQLQGKGVALAAAELLAGEQASAAATLRVELAELKATLATLQAEAVELRPMAKLGKEHLDAVRADALRLYRLAKGGKELPEAIRRIVEGSDIDMARSLRDEYQTDADKALPLKCGRCGSSMVSRASAVGVSVPVDIENGNKLALSIPEDGRPSAGLHD